MPEPFPDFSNLTCPAPAQAGDRVLLAHGEGARLTRRLIREVLLTALDNPVLHELDDAAVLPPLEGRFVLTTDSFVVSPLFFPGGDIGRLAVHGTVNDLAACGAEPLYLSLSLILEEGLPIDIVKRVVASVRDAAAACGVQVVTGDTKVVPKGAADGLFVNTTGVGRLLPGMELGMRRIRPGDRILVSGSLGDHGVAVLAARERLDFATPVASDTAPVLDLVRALAAEGIDVHFLRDPTRGGLAAVLHECAEGSGCSMLLDERSLPVAPAVRGACEILGLDPVHIANEGKLVAFVAERDAGRALACWRKAAAGAGAAVVGEVTDDRPAQVLRKSLLGVVQVLDEPSGAPLPRIC